MLLAAFGCSQSSKTVDAGSGTVTVEQLHDMVQRGDTVFVLDVRTAREFEAERLPFAKLRVPFDSLSADRNLLPRDTSMTIYTFCRSGRRSGIAASVLPKLGYHHVINVEGGIKAWKRAGYETVSGPPVP